MDYRGASSLRDYLDRFLKEPRSELGSRVRQLYDELCDLDLTEISDEALLDLHDVVAPVLGAANLEILRRTGWTLEPWGATPAIRGDDLQVGAWGDHLYRLVNQEQERMIYVAEPYQISAEDMADLERIESEGYTVYLNAEWSLHYPTRTLVIWIERTVERQTQISPFPEPERKESDEQ